LNKTVVLYVIWFAVNEDDIILMKTDNLDEIVIIETDCDIEEYTSRILDVTKFVTNELDTDLYKVESLDDRSVIVK
jgi:hypothetical protein